MSILHESPSTGYGYGARAPDDSPDATTHAPDPADADRQARDLFALPQLMRHHRALLAVRAIRERTDLTATDQQRLQLLADYRAVQAEADWLRARLEAWWPEGLADDPLYALRGVAVDLDAKADGLESIYYDAMAADLRDAASACRAAVGGPTGPLGVPTRSADRDWVPPLPAGGAA